MVDFGAGALVVGSDFFGVGVFVIVGEGGEDVWEFGGGGVLVVEEAGEVEGVGAGVGEEGGFFWSQGVSGAFLGGLEGWERGAWLKRWGGR